jgi:hypothetical protein
MLFDAVPDVVRVGNTATFGWATAGMSSCVVSDPDYPAFTAQNATHTNTSGGMQTPAIIKDTTFTLQCMTLDGSIKKTSLKVMTL